MADSAGAQPSQLKERHAPQPLQLSNAEDAKKKVLELNAAEDSTGKHDKDKRTYGRTPDGTVFIVPHTHDMVSQLLSPSQPKNLSDLLVLAVLASLIVTLYILPASLRIPMFAVIFLFWRAAYNAGIGWLLHHQSNHNRLVLWAKNSRIFENPTTGKNPYPRLYSLLKREMETKIPKDYKFEEAPLEYNTWLVFRRVVDLILMCDFVSYCLFAIACFNQPDESMLTFLGRWAAGIVLFIFNLWVKLDAHRVVKDFAWYWGDFFYLIDQNLTFDGVFEMAPHPMYSVGYAGYYGISLMVASYKVLFISIIAHAAQFAFLTLVENPHIDKTYNPPPKRPHSQTRGQDDRPSSSQSEATSADGFQPLEATEKPRSVHNLMGLQNLDLHRSIDVTVILFQIYIFAFTALTPKTGLVKAFFVINAAVWRLWYSLGIGYILDRQSKKKKWTRHFIKYGDSKEEAWRQWKNVYHLSMSMCHASLFCAAWKLYSLPPDWSYGMVSLRHVVGLALVALQIWTSISIYDSLGEFGWFFGDFFFDPSPGNLTYSGIYRFLNQPERFLGLAGVWGLALITWSGPIFFLALLSHILTLAFIHFVERPHMHKLYGESLRETSGVSKTFRRSLPSPLRQWHGNVDKVINDTVDFVEEIVESAGPKLASGVGTFIKDTTTLFQKYPARISITRLAPDLAGFDPKDYSVTVEGQRSSPAAYFQKSSGRESELARTPGAPHTEFQALMFEYGAPIKVRWTAPLNHSKRDWIGLYMVADNNSREVTRLASNGRWISTNSGQYDSTRPEEGILVSDKLWPARDRKDGENKDCLSGEIEFSGDKLWWTTGVFEFRYHHDGKHNVMAISQPFEIRIPRFDEDDVELDAHGTIQGAVEQALLPVLQNCFDRDPEIAPKDADEAFGSLVERDGKFARRVVFAVHQMFGIELAPEVVQADGNVKNLAWRIFNAKKVLAPYSMSTASNGRNTPTNGNS